MNDISLCYCPVPRFSLLGSVGDAVQPQSTGSVNYHGKRVSDPETRAKLLELSRVLGRTVHISSGDRTPEDQARLIRQGYRPAKNSMHLQGKAADIWVEGMTPKELAKIARQVGFNGIGYYKTHLHVDTRSTLASWYG